MRVATACCLTSSRRTVRGISSGEVWVTAKTFSANAYEAWSALRFTPQSAYCAANSSSDAKRTGSEQLTHPRTWSSEYDVRIDLRRCARYEKAKFGNQQSVALYLSRK